MLRRKDIIITATFAGTTYIVVLVGLEHSGLMSLVVVLLIMLLFVGIVILG